MCESSLSFDVYFKILAVYLMRRKALAFNKPHVLRNIRFCLYAASASILHSMTIKWHCLEAEGVCVCVCRGKTSEHRAYK